MRPAIQRLFRIGFVILLSLPPLFLALLIIGPRLISAMNLNLTLFGFDYLMFQLVTKVLEIVFTTGALVLATAVGAHLADKLLQRLQWICPINP